MLLGKYLSVKQNLGRWLLRPHALGKLTLCNISSEVKQNLSNIWLLWTTYYGLINAYYNLGLLLSGMMCETLNKWISCHCSKVRMKAQGTYNHMSNLSQLYKVYFWSQIYTLSKVVDWERLACYIVESIECSNYIINCVDDY